MPGPSDTISAATPKNFANDSFKSACGDAKMADVLPLATPTSLMVDVASACNFKCSFCPTGNTKLLKSVGRKPTLMSLELFTKIITDLEKFPDPIATLALYKDGEPLLNKSLIQMIGAARKSGKVRNICLATNASLIDAEMAESLALSGLDFIKVAIEHVSDEKYAEITKAKTTYKDIIENVRLLWQATDRHASSLHIHSKIIDTGLTEEEKQRFFDDFSDISHGVRIDPLMGWSNAEGIDFTLGTKPATGLQTYNNLVEKRVCPAPFKSLAINADGSVSVCCVDWSYATVVGDVKKEPLRDIWMGERLRAFCRMQLMGLRAQNYACKDCQYILGYPEYMNLDNDADSLLKIWR
jgi:radical SAM protein with 4Fe4S-binding SPASM domain